ncbi:MAG: hypothetical protein K9N38_00555 [Candidatus Marinimicrobia bacterium]|nr:hypothetical protein [Candidatus Neomarinimicrobiota bacterium]
MELSILIARTISIIYVSTGIAVIIGTLDYNKIVKGLIDSQALNFFFGAVAITAGVFLVEHHNLWEQNWTLIITLISWGLLLGGILVVIFPKFLARYNQLIKNSRLLGAFMTLFGLLMGYFGFFK